MSDEARSRIYSSAEIKKLFGYSEKTSITDVYSMKRAYIEKVGWGKWAVTPFAKKHPKCAGIEQA